MTLRAALLDVPQPDAATWRGLNPLVRWLIACRASVLPLTLSACLFAGLLARPSDAATVLLLLVVTLALLLAHATNNLLNDHVDYATGLDRDNYFRARYGAQPLSQGLMSVARHRRLLLATGAGALALGLVVCARVGGAAFLLAAGGAAILLFYTWPLKRWALGELAVLVVWGPLMVGGVYWVLTGALPAAVLWLATLYGLGPTVVILAKHTDKLADDRARGVKTLPVLLGEPVSRHLIAALAVLSLGGAAAWAFWQGAWWYLLALGASPALVRLLRVLGHTRPADRPEGFPDNVWPLWYAAEGFRFARLAGALLVLAALAEAI
ncbi:MAG: prenyltransferase [Pseudomonadales bacterium]